MKTRTTLVLVILAALAASGIWLFEKDRPGTDARREMQGRLLPGLDEDEVDRLRIERHERPPIEIVRRGDEWALEQPVRDRADTARVERLLGDLAAARTVTTVPANEVLGGDRATGLDAEAVRVVVHGPKGETELLIGQRDAPGGLRYVRTSGGETLSLVRSSLTAALPSDADELRDRSLLGMASVDLDGVTIERDGTTLLALERRDPSGRGAWWITSPFEDEADAGAASALVGQIVGLRTGTFLDDLDAADILAAPRYSIRLERPALAQAGEGSPAAASDEQTGAARLVVRIGETVPGTPLRFASVSDRPPIFEVDVTSLLGELDEPAESLRSMTALDASTWDVDEVELRRGERSITVARVEGEFDIEKKWRVVEPTDAPFDPQRFDGLIGSIARIDALRAAPGVAPGAAGLDEPAATLILRYPDRGEVRLDIGRDAADGEVYARRSGRPTPLVIAAADAARIDPSELAHDVPPTSAPDAAGDGSP